MEFRQLEVFIAVVELSSFSKAGEKLYLSQPTVSAHISSLEKELGVPLLIRNTREVYTSEAGQKLYDYACRLIRLRDEALEAVNAHTASDEGIITIAASTIPAKHILPSLISAFCREHPAISFNIIPCDSATVYEELKKGAVKIGFSGTASNTDSYRHSPIATDKMVIITPNNEHFQQIAAQNNPLPQLLKEPFICRSSSSGTRQEFEKYLAEHNFSDKLNIIAEMHDTEAIKNSVAQGLGISAISERAAADMIRFNLLRAFPLPDGGERLLYIIRSKKDHLIERERLFYNFVLKNSPLADYTNGK